MALLFMDTFQHYYLQSNMQIYEPLRKWTLIIGAYDSQQCTVTGSQNGSYVTPGPSGPFAYSAWSGRGLVKVLPSTYQTLIFGGWYFTGSTTIATNDVLFAVADLGTIQCDVRGDGAGHLTMTRNGTTLATSTNTVVPYTWYYIEAKVKIATGTAGEIDLHVNGSTWIAHTTGLNTSASGTTYANRFQIMPANTVFYNLAFVLDTSGSVANDFIGVCRGAVLRPVAAGAHQDWTAVGANNLGAVSEVFNDGDVSFAQSSTANQIDTFVLNDLPGTVTVYGIQHCILARQDTGTTRTIAPVQRSSSTDYVGTSATLDGTYRYILDARSINPATSAAYTTSDLNAMEAGYKLVS